MSEEKSRWATATFPVRYSDRRLVSGEGDKEVVQIDPLVEWLNEHDDANMTFAVTEGELVVLARMID